MTRVVVVTGTDTDVGKTITVAALAAKAEGRVVVVKPAQTGVGGAEPDPGDAATVHALTGVDVHELVALDDPLAPDTAARRQGVVIPTVAEHARRIRSIAAHHDVVIVEGAGGVLVRLDSDGGTLLDLATELVRTLPAASVEVVVVTRAGLGTLNHTELTVAALRARDLEPVGLVIGAWPDEPGLAETCNREDLPRTTGVPVVAVVPERSGALGRSAFRAAAPSWFAQPALAPPGLSPSSCPS